MTNDPTPLRSDSKAKRYNSLAEMIGDRDNPTPLVRLNSVVPPGAGSFYAKLEWMNPFGSVKDRAAKWMLSALDSQDELHAKAILEATSGNTGIALAGVARLMGLRMVATVPRSMPTEKSVLLHALGATTVPTPVDAPADRHPMDIAFELAEAMIAEEPESYVMPNQYDNPDNVRAHYESTGPEIWAQTEGRVHYFFAGLGTCGTITGAGRFLKEQDRHIRVIGIEPVPRHRISGLKNLTETKVPGILDRSVIDEIVYVDDAETLEMARRLHCEEALFAGSSASAIIAGALKWLAQHGTGGVSVAIAPDSSQKATSYLREMLGE
jgi:cysteine synthase